MSDPIRDALERLVNTSEVRDWELNDREWHDAMCYARKVLADTPRAVLAAHPPAPASTTPDLGALLSPEGAYEGGTGQEDGAQLVSGPHGPEWWAPLYGCDTLDNLLDRLRARILPYLRLPVAGIDVPGCDGDYGDVMDLCAAEGVDLRVGVPLLKRAQEAWKVAAQPPAPTPAPSLDADTLKEVFAKAIARDWSTGWAALSDYVALAVEAQRAPSGNPPATEGSWDDAQRTVAERSHSHIAVSLLQLAAVNARQSRWLSSALCERAAKELESTERLRAAMAADRARRATAPASDGEREKLASQLENLADTFDQGTPEERALERAAALLRQPAPAPAAASDGELTEEEWDELVEKLWDRYVTVGYQGERFIRESDFYTALDLLRPPLLSPAPAAVPAPVAERPWERDGWCDDEGRCWWSHGPTPTARWSLLPMDGMDDAGGWLLPHSAIPIPQPPHSAEMQP